MREVMGFLWRRVRGHPALLSAAVVLVILIIALEVFVYATFVPIIDTFMGGDSGLGDTNLGFLTPFFDGFSAAGRLRLAAGLLFVITVTKSLVSFVYGRVSGFLKIHVGNDLREEVFHSILGAGSGYLAEQRVANLFTFLHSFPKDGAEITHEFLTAFKNLSSFVAAGIVLLSLSVPLTLIALGLAAVTTLLLTWLRNRIRRTSKILRENRLGLHGVSMDMLNGMKVVHQFGRNDHARFRYLSRVRRMQRQQFRQNIQGALMGPLYAILSIGMTVGILIAATFVLPAGGAAWLGILGLFMLVMLQVSSRAANYAKLRSKLASLIPTVEALMDFLEEDKRPLPDGHARFERLHEGVHLQSVSFRYAPSEPPVLQNVSFDIPRGTTVALVGASGAGKSTLVDLLSRLHDPTEGRIVVDGRDLKELKIATWRQQVAVVSQDTFLFNDTVTENIRFGRPDATRADIEEAARLANAHEFIEALPDGFDTELGDRGTRLSGGQRQRIAIARAILANPEVLVLDEATSALDTATERLVQEALERLSANRTVVAVAHRLSTIRNADEIVVLEGGKVVERGDHETLVTRKGAYWRYVQMQEMDAGRPRRGRRTPGGPENGAGHSRPPGSIEPPSADRRIVRKRAVARRRKP